jgi:nitroreductase
MKLSLESIRLRSSVRSYAADPLSSEEEKAIRAAFEEAVPGPFGGRPRFALVSQATAGLGERIGTYGSIKGAPDFIVGAIKRGPNMNEDYGYCLEGIVLRAAELGLGTCWLGGTLHRGRLASLVGLADEELIPAITPIGHASEKRSLQELLVRRASSAATRKPEAELFFEAPPAGVSPAASGPEAFGKPLAREWFDGPWGEILESLRAGPSASNKQPWRVTVSGGRENPAFHLFLHEDRLYNSAMGELKMQNVDMGIAMRHFEAAARARGLPGSWLRLEKSPLAVLPPEHYIASWTAQ